MKNIKKLPEHIQDFATNCYENFSIAELTASAEHRWADAGDLMKWGITADEWVDCVIAARFDLFAKDRPEGSERMYTLGIQMNWTAHQRHINGIEHDIHVMAYEPMTHEKCRVMKSKFNNEMQSKLIFIEV